MPEQINQSCKCTYPCARHGNCEACQEYHRKDGSRTNCHRVVGNKSISTIASIEYACNCARNRE